jgi:hypothetical protein
VELSPSSPTPPPHPTSLSNITVSWGAVDEAKMISMELAPPLMGGPHDNPHHQGYSPPHHEGEHENYHDDGLEHDHMLHDSKRKREFIT